MTKLNHDSDPLTDPIPTVLEVQDYYPFGRVNPWYSHGSDYRFGYQGEYSEELFEEDQDGDNTAGWNAFMLRMYDARIGRWLSVDPERQYASSYKANGNNPLSQGDPTGGYSPEPDWYSDTDGNYVYDSNILSQQDLDAAGIQGTYLGSVVKIGVIGDMDVILNAGGGVSAGKFTRYSTSGGDVIDFGWESGHRVFSGNSMSGNAKSNFYSSSIAPNSLFKPSMVSFGVAGFTSIPFPKALLNLTPKWFHGGYARGWVKGSDFTSIGSFGYRRLVEKSNVGRLIPRALSNLGSIMMWADAYRVGVLMETDSHLNALMDIRQANNPYRGFVPNSFRILRVDWQGKRMLKERFQANQKMNPYRGFVIGI